MKEIRGGQVLHVTRFTEENEARVKAFANARLLNHRAYRRAGVGALTDYRAELARFRAEHGGVRDLPDVPFFLFGMGHRSKFVYRDGQLLDAHSAEVIREWKLGSAVVIPPEYRVEITTAEGQAIAIFENETAVWVEQANQCEALPGTVKPVRLPSFAGHSYARVLRVLHRELLVNITPEGPLPNFSVYSKPWYRDATMMALALRETDNLDLIRDWILGLREPFDRNNAGETESDNLSQVLFLVPLARDPNHPVVPRVLAELPRFEQIVPKGPSIRGRTDFAKHPVYQIKWLKFGLHALGLSDPYVVPAVGDTYSALFWMDYRDEHTPGNDADDRDNYPYLGWACDHFHGVSKSPISNRDYPLTWERRASQANYAGMKRVASVYADLKLATPHTWHAAEVFLHTLHTPTKLSGRSLF